MKISIIDSGLFKLDGGAMFGVVPRVMWEKINPPDENNLCTWSMRCMLIETGQRRILIDTGMGNKQDDKFRSHFHPHGDTDLLSSLAAHGFSPGDITDVFLTHLHFDHVGGAVRYAEDGSLVPTFPNATYWSNERHYQWAMEPNAREKASFLKENFVPLAEAGVLSFIPLADEDVEWMPNIRVRYVYGHTEAMMLPIITYQGKTLVYCADLIPSLGHLGLPYIMSYDLRPLRTLEEKERMLTEAVEHDYYLFFEHDPATSCVSVRRNDRGRIVAGERIEVAELFSA